MPARNGTDPPPEGATDYQAFKRAQRDIRPDLEEAASDLASACRKMDTYGVWVQEDRLERMAEVIDGIATDIGRLRAAITEAQNEGNR